MTTSEEIRKARRKAKGLCVECGKNKVQGRFVRCQTCRDKNKEAVAQLRAKLSYRARRKTQIDAETEIILEHYGAKCNCCGEKEVIFLTIDHIHGRQVHDDFAGRKLRRFIIESNFPSDYQILCMNCNWGRHRNGGICPHKNTLA